VAGCPRSSALTKRTVNWCRNSARTTRNERAKEGAVTSVLCPGDRLICLPKVRECERTFYPVGTRRQGHSLDRAPCVQAGSEHWLFSLITCFHRDYFIWQQSLVTSCRLAQLIILLRAMKTRLLDVTRVWQTTRVTSPAPSLSAVSKNATLTAVPWNKNCEPRFTAHLNSGECCAACHHVTPSACRVTRVFR
jgi:hypothetical protein